jgi:hypothetical protein
MHCGRIALRETGQDGRQLLGAVLVRDGQYDRVVREATLHRG